MTGESKACIACAEDIRAEAALCRFCGTQQSDSQFLNGHENHGDDSAPPAVDRAPPGKVSTAMIATITLSIITVVGAAIAGLLWMWWVSISSELQSVAPAPPEPPPPPPPAVTTPPAPEPTGSEFNIAEIYDAALPSVVTVYCGSDGGSGFSYDLQPASGYRTVIVTNEHVIRMCKHSGGPPVSVQPHQGQTIPGALWSWDDDNDLAIIMIEEALPPLMAASPASIGDPVLVMGTPGGLQGSVTAGIISQVYSDAYQTDAAMNRGNSGGPLLDREGRVLGVNTLGLGREGLNIAFRVELLCDKVVKCG